MSHTHTARFDWKSPPLTENDRMNRYLRARIVRDVRLAGRLAFLPLARTGPHDHVNVQLTWYVPDHRRRDTDNVVPTLKALCDGIVDAGIVPDDTPRYMTKPEVIIEVQPGVKPYIAVTVTATP